MVDRKSKENNKKRSSSIIKILNVKTILVLIVLLTFNSYAWFIYSTRVNVGMTAKVRAWEVVFRVNENQIVSNVDINVQNIYPGMETFVEKIDVHNEGELLAKLSYVIKSLTVLGNKYDESEGYTTEEFVEMLNTIYPFKISIEINDENLYEENGKGQFIVKVDWPFESGNDELDTYWGQQAYEFNKENADKSSISMEILLTAEQST